MKLIAQKNWKRLISIASNTVFLTLPGVLNLIISVIIIRFYHEEWWGRIVEIQLVFYFTGSISAWGNKEYLLREFSKSPAWIRKFWQQSFSTRAAILLLPSLLLILFIYPIAISFNLALWVLMKYISQSYESIITYEKKFNLAVTSELISLLSLILMIYFFRETLSFELLLILISLSYTFKTIFLVAAFKKYLPGLHQNYPQIKLLGFSFVFMLLGFTGLVQSKIDLLVLDLYMSKKDLAKYQVITNLLILIKTGSSFILYPFVKNIYRLSKEKIISVANTVLAYGFIITLAGLLLQYLILKFIYHYETELSYYIYGIIYCLPGFWFSPIVFYLFKHNKQMKVILINITGIVTSSLFCYLLISHMAINGALISIAISQIIMLIMYSISFRMDKDLQASS